MIQGLDHAMRHFIILNVMQATKAPPKFKKKSVYFLKTQQVKLDNESIKKLVRISDFWDMLEANLEIYLIDAHLQVIHGEIGENPLESLAAVAQDVFVPMLTQPANQQGWPDVVAKEVTEVRHAAAATWFQHSRVL